MQKVRESLQVQPLLTIPQVAKVLGVSRPTVYELMYRHGLPRMNIGRSVRIHPASFQRWLAEREQS